MNELKRNMILLAVMATMLFSTVGCGTDEINQYTSNEVQKLENRVSTTATQGCMKINETIHNNSNAQGCTNMHQ